MSALVNGTKHHHTMSSDFVGAYVSRSTVQSELERIHAESVRRDDADDLQRLISSNIQSRDFCDNRLQKTSDTDDTGASSKKRKP